MTTKVKKVESGDDLDAIDSSGNVFADLGLPDADELLLKARLATKLKEMIKARGWSQRKAAAVLGLPQPEVCALMNGKLRGFSLARILRSLKAMGAFKVSVHIEFENEHDMIVSI
jgi:predicted XRE-type DNA-binding protein